MEKGNKTKIYLEEAYTQCVEIGNILRELSNSNPDNLRYRVYTQLMKRIYNCLSVLRILGLNDITINTITLTYRSALYDTYLLLFLIHQENSDFENAITRLNIDHTKFVIASLPLHMALGRRVFKPSEENDESDQDMFDRHYDKFQPYLDCHKGESWKAKKAKPLTTKEIFDFFKSRLDENGESMYYPFYEAFRVLSQTEHYSEIGFGYSVLGSNHNNFEIVQYNTLLFFGMTEFKRLFDIVQKNNKFTD